MSADHEPLYDIDPQTGTTTEVFYADRTLETFGRCGAGWFWWPRQRGPFAGWLAYWAVRYKLRSVSACDEYLSQKRTTPLQPNMLAGRRWFMYWALKSPSAD